MRPVVLCAAVGLAVAGCATDVMSSTTPSAGGGAFLLTDAVVKAPGGWAEAVAVRDGVIVGVGDGDALSDLIGPDAQRIDLDGATVLPGLHDMHVHPLYGGLEEAQCALEPGAAPEDIAAAVSACAADKAPGEWVIGGNWVAAVFEPGEQTLAFLDAAAPDNPVLLNDESYHSLWANSLALERAGVTADTPDPEGGIIERDASGELTGIFRETATNLIEAAAPPPSVEEMREALIYAAEHMASYGVTSFTIASVRPPEVGVLAALSEEGLMKQRVRGCLRWTPDTEETLQASKKLLAERARYARERFATDCVKIFVDGVPIESRTAAMLEPYAHAEHGERGDFLIPPDELAELTTEFDRQGLLIKFHVTGDAAVRAAIDAVAAAREANGWGGRRHDVGHNSFVDPADIPRVRDLHMAWEFSPYIWYPTPIADVDVRGAVGDERMERFTPIKDAVDTGAVVVVGSDWSVVPSVNPWLGMETMVTRQAPGGSEATVGERQRVSLETAFAIFTEQSAQLMGHRDKVGSIEVGMRADLIVTARNPFDIPITDVHDMEVLMTFIDGELVYKASPAGAEDGE